jgi:putative chitinase
MTPTDWLIVLTLGLIMGAVGQGARIVIGLKKAKDEAAASSKTLADVFEPSTLLVSLLIGAAAGAVAAVTTITSNANVSSTMLLALAAAGYSGSDFLEGLMAKFVPDQGLAPAPASGTARGSATAIPSPGPAPGPRTPLDQPQADVRPLPADR